MSFDKETELDIDENSLRDFGDFFSVDGKENFPYDPNVAHHSVIGMETDYGSRVLTTGDGDQVKLEFFLEKYTQPRKVTWTFPCDFIDFTPELGEEIFEKVAPLWEAALDLKKLAFDPLTSFEEPVRSTLHTFLVDLWTYTEGLKAIYKGNIRFLIEPFEILRNSLLMGPKYAKWIDGFKTAVIHHISQAHLLTDEIRDSYGPELAKLIRFLDDQENREKFSISMVYRANSLFHWTPPSFKPEGVLDKEVVQDENILNDFRRTLRAYLQSEIFIFAAAIPWESLQSDSTKKNYNSTNLLTKRSEPAVFRGASRIAEIPRELKESRWATVEEYSSALRIRWIDANVKAIIDLDKRSAYRYKPSTLSEKIRVAMQNRHPRYQRRGWKPTAAFAYCRDFKKEGLTKPRNLLKIMLEELHDRFPHFRAFDNPGFFDNWAPLYNGAELKTKRGHGLGMANALTTLMQFIIEDMVCKVLDAKPKWSCYLNDDAAIVFSGEREATAVLVRNYRIVDRNVCKALSLEFKEKASFISDRMCVLCEIYNSPFDYPCWGRKDVFGYMSQGITLKAINASHARSLSVSSTSFGLSTEFLTSVQTYWGWVLYAGEHKAGAVFGGWARERFSGVELDFYRKSSHRKLHKNEYSAYIAYQSTELRAKPWLKGRVKPKIYDDLSKEYLAVKEVKDIFLKDVIRPTIEKQNAKRMWISYEKVLKKNFSSTMSDIDRGFLVIPTYRDLYLLEVEKRPQVDILPPRGMYEHVRAREEGVTKDVAFHHPYNGQPILSESILAREEDYHYIIKAGISKDLNLAVAEEERDCFAGSRAIRIREEIFGPKALPHVWNVYLIPPMGVMKYWHDPFSVTKVADAFGSYYNSIRPNYNTEELTPKRHKLLSSRARVYGRELSPTEWMALGSLHPGDRILAFIKRKIIGHPCINPEEIFIQLTKPLGRYPGFGALIPALVPSLDESRISKLFLKYCFAKKIFNDRSLADIPPYEDRNMVFLTIGTSVYRKPPPMRGPKIYTDQRLEEVVDDFTLTFGKIGEEEIINEGGGKTFAPPIEEPRPVAVMPEVQVDEDFELEDEFGTFEMEQDTFWESHPETVGDIVEDNTLAEFGLHEDIPEADQEFGLYGDEPPPADLGDEEYDDEFDEPFTFDDSERDMFPS